MTSKITPSCKSFTTISARKGFHTSITVLPGTPRVIRTIFALVILLLLLLLLHVHILERAIPIVRWQHWHPLLQLGPGVVAHALRNMVLELPFGGSGNSSRVLSVQNICDIHS